MHSSYASAPPPILLDCWLSHYVRVGRSIPFSGRTNMYVDGREVGRVPCLAIGHAFRDGEVRLFHCGRSWAVRGNSPHATVSAAKEQAERLYHGIGGGWLRTGLTGRAARAKRTELWKHLACSFCGAPPPDVEKTFASRGVTICDVCIREFSAHIAPRNP